MRNIKVSLLHAILPISIVLIYLSFMFKGQREMQTIIGLVGVASYLGVSLIHHKKDKSLTFKTVLEYILVAGLVVGILLGLNFL